MGEAKGFKKRPKQDEAFVNIAKRHLGSFNFAKKMKDKSGMFCDILRAVSVEFRTEIHHFRKKPCFGWK